MQLGGTVIVTGHINIIHSGGNSHSAKLNLITGLGLVKPAVFFQSNSFKQELSVGPSFGMTLSSISFYANNDPSLYVIHSFT